MSHEEAVLKYGNHDGLADTLFPRFSTDLGDVRVIQRETETAPYQVAIDSLFGRIDILQKSDVITFQSTHMRVPGVQIAFQIEGDDWTALRVTDARVTRRGKPLEVTFTRRDGVQHDPQKTGRGPGVEALVMTRGIDFPKDHTRVRQTPFFCEVSRKGKSLRTEFMTATTIMSHLHDALRLHGQAGMNELVSTALAVQIALSNSEQPTYEIQIENGRGVLYETALHTPIAVARKNDGGMELLATHETAYNLHSYLRTENGKIVEYAVYQNRTIDDKHIMVGISVDIVSGRMRQFTKEPVSSPEDSEKIVQDVVWGSKKKPVVIYTSLDEVVIMHDVDRSDGFRKPDKTMPGSLRMSVENGVIHAESGGDTIEIDTKKIRKDVRLLDKEYRPTLRLIDTTALLRAYDALNASH